MAGLKPFMAGLKPFMAGLEKRIFHNSGYHPYLWLRVLDDMLCILTDGLKKLQEFFKFLKDQNYYGLL